LQAKTSVLISHIPIIIHYGTCCRDDSWLKFANVFCQADSTVVSNTENVRLILVALNFHNGD
jgi:hypothetical protein